MKSTALLLTLLAHDAASDRSRRILRSIPYNTPVDQLLAIDIQHHHDPFIDVTVPQLGKVRGLRTNLTDKFLG
jgi:hypothetical protein